MTNEQINRMAGRLMIISMGFGTRRVKDADGREYFCHDRYIFGTGHTFAKEKLPGGLPRPHVHKLPTGFDLVAKMRVEKYVDNSREFHFTSFADELALEALSEVYESAYRALPRWRRMWVGLRGSFGAVTQP